MLLETDPNCIFQGGVGDWFLGVAESVGHAPKMFRIGTLSKTVAAQEILQ